MQAFYGHFDRHEEQRIRAYVEKVWKSKDVDFKFLKEAHYAALRKGILAKSQSLPIIKLAHKMLKGDSFALDVNFDL